MRNSPLREKFSFYFSRVFSSISVVTKLSFWRRGWALGYRSMKFETFSKIPNFLRSKILWKWLQFTRLLPISSRAVITSVMLSNHKWCVIICKISKICNFWYLSHINEPWGTPVRIVSQELYKNPLLLFTYDYLNNLALYLVSPCQDVIHVIW